MIVTKEMIEAGARAGDVPDHKAAEIITAALAAMPVPVVPCPCTTFEQDEDCPIGYPSLLCSVCKGTGVSTADAVTELAAEMLKVAEQVDEIEDPFAAWETIELLKSQSTALTPATDLQAENERMRAALHHIVKHWPDDFSARYARAALERKP